jgi:hypothetical protein
MNSQPPADHRGPGRPQPTRAPNAVWAPIPWSSTASRRPAAAAATHIELNRRATAEPRLMAALTARSWLAALTVLFLWRELLASPTMN